MPGIMIVDIDQNLDSAFRQARNQISPTLKPVLAIDHFFVPSCRDRFNFIAVAEKTDINKIPGHRIEFLRDLVAMGHPSLVDQYQRNLMPS